MVIVRIQCDDNNEKMHLVSDGNYRTTTKMCKSLGNDNKLEEKFMKKPIECKRKKIEIKKISKDESVVILTRKRKISYEWNNGRNQFRKIYYGSEITTDSREFNNDRKNDKFTYR